MEDAEQPQPDIATSNNEAWKKSLNKVVPCVVVLKVTLTRAVDTEPAGSAYATGFIVDKARGIILTNRHVLTPGPIVADAIFLNREEVPVLPLYYDPVHDFGFLRFDPSKLQFMQLDEVPLAPEAASVGLDIRVVGNDSGEKVSILSGVLARLDRDAPAYGKKTYNDFNTFYLQAASGTKGGSSGSPVVDIHGRAVGLNAGGKNKAASAYYLPLDRVVRALRIIQGQKVLGSPAHEWPAPRIPRGDLQTTFVFKGFDEVRRLGLQQETERAVRAEPGRTHGNTGGETLTVTGMFVVESVQPGSPSDGVLEAGDVLVKIQDKIVTHFLTLEEILDDAVGQEVTVCWERGGKPMQAAIRVTNLHSVTPSSFLEVSGGAVHALSYQQARNNRVVSGQVYVAEPGYMLARAGVPKHAIITSLAGQQTPDILTFGQLLRGFSHGARVPLEFFTFTERNRKKSAILHMDRQWYGAPVYWTRDDAAGCWHPNTDWPPVTAAATSLPAPAPTADAEGQQAAEAAAALDKDTDSRDTNTVINLTAAAGINATAAMQTDNAGVVKAGQSDDAAGKPSVAEDVKEEASGGGGKQDSDAVMKPLGDDSGPEDSAKNTAGGDVSTREETPAIQEAEAADKETPLKRSARARTAKGRTLEQQALIRSHKKKTPGRGADKQVQQDDDDTDGAAVKGTTSSPDVKQAGAGGGVVVKKEEGGNAAGAPAGNHRAAMRRAGSAVGMAKSESVLAPVVTGPLRTEDLEDRLRCCMVLVDVDIPLVALSDGVHARSFAGNGLIVHHGEKIGLVVVDRNTVVVGPSDVMLSFGAHPSEIRGRVRFLHPLHNFAIVSYDPQHLPPEARAKVVAAHVGAAPAVKRGDSVYLAGLTKSLRIMLRRSTVTTATTAVIIPAPEVPRFRAVHEEVIKLDQDFGATFSGVLTDDYGRVKALWGSYAEQVDREEREWCSGLPSATFWPWVQRLLQLEDNPTQLPPTVRTLEAELEPLVLSKAAQFNLPQEWVTRLDQLDPERRQVLRVRSTVAADPKAKADPSVQALQSGDMLLAVAGKPVTCFRDVESIIATYNEGSTGGVGDEDESGPLENGNVSKADGKAVGRRGRGGRPAGSGAAQRKRKAGTANQAAPVPTAAAGTGPTSNGRKSRRATRESTAGGSGGVQDGQGDDGNAMDVDGNAAVIATEAQDPSQPEPEAPTQAADQVAEASRPDDDGASQRPAEAVTDKDGAGKENGVLESQKGEEDPSSKDQEVGAQAEVAVTLPVTIFRGGQIQELRVRLGKEPGMATDRLVHWAGAQLQAPHRAVRELGFLPEASGVYISRWHHGSPAHRYGLYALHWVLEVNGHTTPDLDTFLKVVAPLRHGDFARVKLIHLETTQVKVLTLKMDLIYWPTWELVLDQPTCAWSRRTISGAAHHHTQQQQPQQVKDAPASQAEVKAG